MINVVVRSLILSSLKVRAYSFLTHIRRKCVFAEEAFGKRSGDKNLCRRSLPGYCNILSR